MIAVDHFIAKGMSQHRRNAVGALALDPGHVRGGVVGQPAGDVVAVRSDNQDGVTPVEPPLDVVNAHWQQAPALLQEGGHCASINVYGCPVDERGENPAML